MSDIAKFDDEDRPREVRMVFPEACKWFQSEDGKPTSALAASEIVERFQRFQKNNTSPCDNCPLCPGHE